MGREESVSLSEEVSNWGFCPDILASVKSRLSEEQRLALDRPFSAEDVKEALFQMDGCKAPGPRWIYCCVLSTKLGMVR